MSYHIISLSLCKLQRCTIHTISGQTSIYILRITGFQIIVRYGFQQFVGDILPLGSIWKRMACDIMSCNVLQCSVWCSTCTCMMCTCKCAFSGEYWNAVRQNIIALNYIALYFIVFEHEHEHCNLSWVQFSSVQFSQSVESLWFDLIQCIHTFHSNAIISLSRYQYSCSGCNGTLQQTFTYKYHRCKQNLGVVGWNKTNITHKHTHTYIHTYWYIEKRVGMYDCASCGIGLFDSSEKYDDIML